MRPNLGLILFCSMSLSTPIVLGQSSSKSHAFEVATIRPAAPVDMKAMTAQMQAGQTPRLGVHVSSSRAEYIYMSLKDLISIAYDMKAYQINGPGWLADQRFDIVAKISDQATPVEAPAMLRTLLEERFKLVTHRETQRHKVLALVINKGIVKMKPSTANPQPIDENAPLKQGEMKLQTADGTSRAMRNSDGGITVNMGVKGIVTQRMDMQRKVLHLESSMVTMQGLADMLTNVLQMSGGNSEQVIDMTGLQGNFQVALDIPLQALMQGARTQGMSADPSDTNASNLSPTDVDDNSSIFGSLDALGLKLESRDANVERLVIDSVQRGPTAN